MPPIFVHEDPDGLLEITDGVTRHRAVPCAPERRTGQYRRSRASSPCVKDRL
jgi:hypothetical protein